MSAIDPFLQYSVTAFYHFTDRRNLVQIRESGGLYSFAELQRRGIHIEAPGGNQWSHDADAFKHLDRYVHLCFKPNHPMEYALRQEGRIQDSIFLEIHPDILKKPGIMFSPDVANKSGVPILPLENAYELIDFEVLYKRTNWKDEKIQARRAGAEKCEILVPDHIPLAYLGNLPNG